MKDKQLKDFLVEKSQEELSEWFADNSEQIIEDKKELSLEEIKEQKVALFENVMKELNKVLVDKDTDNKFLLERNFFIDVFKIDINNFNSLNYILEKLKAIRETKAAYERNIKAIKKLEDLLSKVSISSMDIMNTKNIVGTDAVFELKTSNTFNTSTAVKDKQLITTVFESENRDDILDAVTVITIDAVKLKKFNPDLYNKHLKSTLSIKIKENA